MILLFRTYQYFWSHLTRLACIKTITLNRLLYFISNWLFIRFQIICSQNQFGWEQLYSCLGSFNPIFCLYFCPFSTRLWRETRRIMKILMGTDGLCGDLSLFSMCSFSSLSATILNESFSIGVENRSWKLAFHSFITPFSNLNEISQITAWWLASFGHLSLFNFSSVTSFYSILCMEDHNWWTLSRMIFIFTSNILPLASLSSLIWPTRLN